MKKRKATGFLKEIWNTMSRSIYVGERLQANMKALTFISIVCAVLGLVLVVINSFSGQTMMLITSVFTFIAGVTCWYCASVLKDRQWSIMIPTVFCMVFFTVYAITGAGEGSAILWSLLVPIGMCYFVSVRGGILLSAYYSVLYLVIFYTPLGNHLNMYYTDKFMTRFPILYISLAIFTGASMMQYHRMALLEIDYTERLNDEVRKQTAVAEERSRKIEQMSFQTIRTLANAIDAKDPYTKGHSTRVSHYSVMIAEALGWDRERISDLRFAAMLHDIGKIGVPDSILNKPRNLTDVEYDIIKSHTTMGGDILREKIMIENAEEIARSHHERYDGRGYPRGLKGEEISEEARIVAIADAFDAMSSDRVYRKACDRSHIIHELQKGKGKQFDPRFADIFLDLLDRGLPDRVQAEDDAGEDGDLEASSVLLQEVMEAFAAQNGADAVDVTTGVMGRAAGESAIAQQMKTEQGCLVFFDLDNLKRINDTNGHDAGDRALALAGEILLENGDESLSCRLGGDEFLYYMKNVTREEAEQRVQSMIHEFGEKKRRDTLITPASLSAGMAMCTPADSYTSVYNKADKALYYVKQNGKNSCSMYNDDSEFGVSEPADLHRLISGIRDSGNYEGAMDVEYRQFAKLYEFVTNLKIRFHQSFSLIMITLESEAGDVTHTEELETAMYCMEQAIRQAIRNVDVLTRYGRQQFLIILLGTDQDGVRIAVDRIFRGYYKMNGGSVFTPSYTVADPEE